MEISEEEMKKYKFENEEVNKEGGNLRSQNRNLKSSTGKQNLEIRVEYF